MQKAAPAAPENPPRNTPQDPPNGVSDESPADEQLRKVARLIGRLWQEQELVARMQAAPREVLAEAGLPVPEGIEVAVVFDSGSEHHLVLPPAGHPQRQLLERVEAKLRESSAVPVTLLEDRPDLIHFVIPARPANFHADLDEDRLVALVARSSLGSAVFVGEELLSDETNG